MAATGTVSLNTLGTSIEKLDDNNYAVWSIKMPMALIAKGLGAAIDPPPAADGKSAPPPIDPAIDKQARALIGLSVTNPYLSTVARAPTAKDALASLEAIFRAKTTARQLELRRRYATLKMCSGESATKYIARARDLLDEMRGAGCEPTDNDMALAALAGLPPAFNVLATIITSQPCDKLTLDTLLSTLVQEEARQRPADSRSMRTTDAALMAKPNFKPGWAPRSNQPRRDERRHDNQRRGDQRGDPRPFGGRRPDNRAHGMSSREQEERDRALNLCLYCHKPGHMARECRQKTREMAARRAGGSTAPQPYSQPANPQYSAIAFSARTSPPTPLAPEDSAALIRSYLKKRAAIEARALSTHFEPEGSYAAYAAPPSGPTDAPESWIIDTGATRHITPNSHLLSNLRAPPDITVTFGNGTHAKPAAMGDAYFQPTGSGPPIKLTDVLYMPDAADNLLSVSQAAAHGIAFSFTTDGCTIDAADGTPIATAPTAGTKMFYLDGRTLHPAPA